MEKACVLTRETLETKIKLELTLNQKGIYEGSTGIGFFDHMLNLLAKHGNFMLKIEAQGDLEVDGHHLVEDIGIVLGKAFNECLGDRSGITRYGHVILPMDEALILGAVDFGGRPYLNYQVELPKVKLGEFDVELVEEFLRAFVNQAGVNLHIKLLEGRNIHHIIEGIFKAFARCIRVAVAKDSTVQGVLSTKGMIIG
jgi:imidazoleglycerol-phosphate dehydratase